MIHFKRVLLAMILCLFVGNAAQAQVREFYKFIEKNLRYPKQAIENKIEGRVYVKFTIYPDDSIGNIKVLKGLGYGCDEEALRVLNLKGLPRLGHRLSRRSRKVVQRSIAITFKLDKNNQKKITSTIVQ